MKKRVDPIVGKKITEKLTITERIGRGGMGSVYKAHHGILDKDFAVKILRSDMRKDPVVVERFKREARAASRLEHQSVVFISDFDQLNDGRFYIVMEYIPGKSLRDIIQKSGQMDILRGCKILSQISEALDYAHEKGVIHRDLKSENIFIIKRREMERVKILDFGLAKLVSDALDLQSITSEGQIFGTPETMAPEQIGSSKVDHRVDIYALGVLTYEIFTGKQPFSGPMLKVLMDQKKTPVPLPSKLRPDLPVEIDELVIKAMAKKPVDRFSRASEMQLIFDNLIKNLAKPPKRGNTGFSLEIATSGAFPSTDSIDKKSESSWMQKQFNEYVLEVAEHLRDRSIGSPKITQSLAHILDLEEQLTLLKSDQNHLIQRYDNLEHTGRLRASKLRHAIISLNIEIKNMVQNGSKKSEIQDVKYQLMELEKRLAKVVSMQESDEQEIELKISDFRTKIEEMEYRIKIENENILALVLESEKDTGTSSTLKTAFQKLHFLKNKLDQN